MFFFCNDYYYYEVEIRPSNHLNTTAMNQMLIKVRKLIRTCVKKCSWTNEIWIAVKKGGSDFFPEENIYRKCNETLRKSWLLSTSLIPLIRKMFESIWQTFVVLKWLKCQRFIFFFSSHNVRFADTDWEYFLGEGKERKYNKMQKIQRKFWNLYTENPVVARRWIKV